MSELETSFLDLLVQVHMGQFGIGSDDGLIQALSDLHVHMQSTSDLALTFLFDAHRDNLLKCKHYVKDLVRTKPEFRSLYDKVFIKARRLAHNTPRYITVLFEKLIEGITYFAKQSDPPIDHRPALRGSDTGGSSHTYSIDEQTSVDWYFLEGLIYDALWRVQTQDEAGYIHRNLVSETDGADCVPGLHVEATVEQTDSIPDIVTLSFHKDGVLIVEDIFKKEVKLGDAYTYTKVYDEVVDCTRITPTETLAKVQTFAREMPWVNVDDLIALNNINAA
jgi:hypothetical protein